MPVSVLAQVQCFDAEGPGTLESLRHEVDPDDLLDAEVARYAARHVSDRSQPQNDDASAFRDVGVCNRLPCGGQHVREVDEAVVGWSLWHLDRAELRLWDSQELRLPARHLSVEFRVAEQRGPHPLFADLGGLALGEQTLIAHETVPAGDLEGNDDAVARSDVRHLAADLLDDSHGLVAENVAGLHERPHDLIQVQIGTADAG